MSKIVITGGQGLLGWHTRCHLHGNGILAANADRNVFATESNLDEMIAGSDVVIHFAGMNRGEEDEIYDTNVLLTEKLLASLDRTSTVAHLIFSSSTHVSRDTRYGESKRRCADLIQKWVGDLEGRRASILILPNVYGESGMPFYNSVVSTFCHMLSQRKEPVIESDSEMTLIHARRVASLVCDEIGKANGKNEFDVIEVGGDKLTVSELLKVLSEFDDVYHRSGGIVPNLDRNLHLDLFNTYRSYLFPQSYPAAIQSHRDQRGSLVEIVKSNNGGQSFFSTTKPGVTRGNHYHRNKVERFVVIGGKGLIRIRKLFESKVHEFLVNGGSPSFIDMPTFHTHSIENVGNDEMVTMFWSNEIFDPDNPDTFYEDVLQDAKQ